MDINKYKTLSYKGISIEMEQGDDEIDIIKIVIDQILNTNKNNLAEITKIKSNIDLKWKYEIPGEYIKGRSIILNYNSKINFKYPLFINSSEKL